MAEARTAAARGAGCRGGGVAAQQDPVRVAGLDEGAEQVEQLP
jgi:hypothetical protein